MSTINDVARRAGVSAMTVSRVVNNSGYIGAETRARVEEAIETLGYVPNALGRQLRSKQTKLLGLVLSDITNPFFTTIARGVEDAARAGGFNVVFCNTDESETEERRYLRTLVERQVDGILLVPASSSGASLRLLAAQRIPVVLIDRRVRRPNVDSVGADSEAGARDAVRHLIDLGHRRIAVLSGRADVSTSADRVAGARHALAEAGLALDERLVAFGDYNYAEGNGTDGYEMARRVLAVEPRPTAILAANNFIALGALRALREARIAVPDEVSIVAFDDLPPDWVVEPFLTVVAQPAYEIGRTAAEVLLERLGPTPPAISREILLSTELVLRRSTGRVPAAAPDRPLVAAPVTGREAAAPAPARIPLATEGSPA